MTDIIHGDCIAELQKITQPINCIITDPPYGVLTSGKTVVKGYQKGTYNNHCDWDNIPDLEKFTKEWFELCYDKLENNSFFYIFWSQKYFKMGMNIFNPSRVVFWRYNNLTLGGNGDFAYDYEPIYVVKKGNPKLIKGKHSCDMEFTKPQSTFKKDKLVHPTQKPLALCEHLVRLSTKDGDTVLDPFGGGGTTYIAAKNEGRSAITIERELDYYNIIVAREAVAAASRKTPDIIVPDTTIQPYTEAELDAFEKKLAAMGKLEELGIELE